MPEMVSLMTITRGSFQAFWKHRILWWFAIPAGILVSLSSFVSTTAQNYLPETPNLSSLTSFFLDHRIILTLGIALVVVLCQSLIRGALVALFAHRMNETDPILPKKTLPWRHMFRGSRMSMSFEAAYWLVLIGIGIVLVIPSLLAQRFNPSIMPTVFELGFLLLITIGVYLYFTKELSCFYAILGKTGFWSAGDLGFRLFRRHAFNTVLFFFYAALLAIFFSLLTEFFLRMIRLRVEQQALFMAVPFGFYYIFDQLLHVSFFRSIATTPKKPVAKEAVLETSQTPSGISPN